MPDTHTERPGGRKYKRIDWGKQPLPPCQHGSIVKLEPCEKPGEFDAPTKYGPWTDLCDDHLVEHTFRDSVSGFHRIPSQ
jgi:hypothetical protein